LNQSIIKEAENIAILIQAEELISNQMNESSQMEINADAYLDNNYFWKTYSINMDLSEL